MVCAQGSAQADPSFNLSFQKSWKVENSRVSYDADLWKKIETPDGRDLYINLVEPGFGKDVKADFYVVEKSQDSQVTAITSVNKTMIYEGLVSNTGVKTVRSGPTMSRYQWADKSLTRCDSISNLWQKGMGGKLAKTKSKCQTVDDSFCQAYLVQMKRSDNRQLVRDLEKCTVDSTKNVDLCKGMDDKWASLLSSHEGRLSKIRTSAVAKMKKIAAYPEVQYPADMQSTDLTFDPNRFTQMKNAKELCEEMPFSFSSGAPATSAPPAKM